MGTEVCQFVLLELSPDVFGWIQLGSVGGQVVDFDAAVQAADGVGNDPAAMGGKAVPDQQDGPVYLLPQMSEEISNLLLSHGSFVEPEVELPLSDPRGDGEVVPVELMLKNGRNSTWGPGAHPMGALTQAALVYEDDDPAFFLGFF